MSSEKLAVAYVVRVASPEAHIFGVTMTIAAPQQTGQLLHMPAWIPGSYMIRDFAKNIIRLKADCSGEPVAVAKVDKQTWRCAPCKGPVEISYEVYAWDLSVRTAYLDTTRGYFNGPSIFLRAEGLAHEAHVVDLYAPEGDGFNTWRVATSMTPAGAEPYGFGRYEAESYQELIDHPVELGSFVTTSFRVGGVRHDVAITGRQRADLDRLCDDLQRICETQVDLFGELPVSSYLFLITAVGEGYGGLEHASSCSLLCSRNDLPRPEMEKASDEYRSFLGLCSHEYFHLWNVKRIRPAVFMPDDLRGEVYTELLWAFEGITSYYDDLALVRSGCIDEASYLELLARTITRVLRGSGRLKQTLADSSFDAWTKFYKQDENAPNAIVSYYTKGALVALALDLTVRKDTAGAKSLDDVMRALWERYGRSNKGVPEDGVETTAAEISGLDLRSFFDSALRGTDDLPLQELLADFGITMALRPASGPSDRGGVLPEKPKRQSITPVLGARVAAESGETRLLQVFDDSAAQTAGLAAGDVVVAIDGIKVTPANISRLIGGVPAGETITVHCFRRDELMAFEVKPLPPPLDTCELRLADDPPTPVLERRRAWLAGRS